jgi:hypothetical protein
MGKNLPRQKWMATSARAVWKVRTLLGVVALLLVGGASAVRANTTLSVDIGWGGRLRAHRWTPLFVTASDSKSRNVEIEVSWPHGGNYAMRVHQRFTIGPTPTTFPLLMPVHGFTYGYQDAMYTLRDAGTGKSLAHFPPQPGMITQSMAALDPSGMLVGVTGRQSRLESLQGNVPERALGVSYLRPAYLPTAAIGYDAIDLLVLNQPNLNTVGGSSGDPPIDATQQQAMIDWVRAGGNLMLWPGETGLPASGPLVDLLPCRTGDRLNLELSADELKEAGLGARFARTSAFTLVAEKDAERIDLLDGKAIAYSKRYGLGRITVVPVIVAGLQFNTPEQGHRFWKPLLDPMHLSIEAPDQNS